MTTDYPAFVCVAGLYAKTAQSGRVVYVGMWHGKRVYLLPCDANNGPAWWLAVRAEDYDPANHGGIVGATKRDAR